MLEPGQTVLYGTEGICTIEAIETLRIGGKRSKYYVLRPVYRTRATIYVPTDNELLCSRMRPVLSEPEIESLLQSAAGESISWIDDPNERKQVFAQILSGVKLILSLPSIRIGSPVLTSMLFLDCTLMTLKVPNPLIFTIFSS